MQTCIKTNAYERQVKNKKILSFRLSIIVPRPPRSRHRALPPPSPAPGSAWGAGAAVCTHRILRLVMSRITSPLRSDRGKVIAARVCRSRRKAQGSRLKARLKLKAHKAGAAQPPRLAGREGRAAYCALHSACTTHAAQGGFTESLWS